jgi:prepilin-type N-terminal cleavage/methylation domain-containing protein
MKVRPARDAAFTLVELLVAIAILVSIVLILTSLITAVSKAWASGEQQVSEFQDGRAILELISRELSQAVISPSLQFIQNPSLGSTPQRANSDSIFWQAPAASTSNGNLAEIGFYLTDDGKKTGADRYQLCRFCVSPSDPNYQIFLSPNQPTDTSAPWVTNYVTKVSTPPITTAVASGVLALWIRCFDYNGDLIPWLSSNATGVGSMKFNSAAHFQPAIAGQTTSFKYTNASTTVRANLLPATVELTIVTLDPTSFRRSPSIPPQNAQVSFDDLPNMTSAFSKALISSNIRNARTFSTRVNLVNSGQR